MIKLITILTGILLMVSVCGAAEKPALQDKKAKDSYSLGYEFGNNLRMQEIDLDESILFDAIRDGLKGNKPAIRSEEIYTNLKALRKQVLIKYNIRRNALAAENKKEGEAFLAANKSRSGIITLPSGLQYKVLREGSGPSPQAADLVKVIYRGALLNGVVFDSSDAGSGPATVKVNGMIPGWVEALQLMKTGSKWQLFVPAELGYGGRGYGKVPPNSVLVFDLELVSIEKDAHSIMNEPAAAGESSAAVSGNAEGKPTKQP